MKHIKPDPELAELLRKAAGYKMTPEEIEAQRQSWVRGMQPCEHGVRDWETCPDCLRKHKLKAFRP